MFGSLGVPELLLIFVVVLIVFGPRRIPEIGRTLGKALGEFRRATDDLKNTIEREVRLEELKKIAPPTMESFITPAASVSRSAPVAFSDDAGVSEASPANGSAGLVREEVVQSSRLPVDEGSSAAPDEPRPLGTSTARRLDDASTAVKDDSSAEPDVSAAKEGSTTRR